MKVNVAICQMNVVWEDAAANLAELRRLLDNAELTANALVVLPEAFATGFSMNAEVVCKESENVRQTLSALAKDRKIRFIAGVATADGNVAVVIDADGKEVGVYTKVHPFSPMNEANAYPPGDDVHTFNLGGMRLTPLICYDLRFPEIFRRAAYDTDVYVVIANWPAIRNEHWLTLLKARAIENQAYVIGVNRTGSDPNAKYCGSSVVYDPNGICLVAPFEEAAIIRIDVEIDEVNRVRAAFPALRDCKFNRVR